MAQLSETFPTLDCSQCILTPRTVEAGHHDNIMLMAYSSVEKVEGEAGRFMVTVRRKARYVDWDKCTGCGICQEKCPWRIPSDFDRQLAKRKVIYTLSAQAIPNKPVIDRSQCAFFARNTCRACEKFCPVGAIDFYQEDETVSVEAAAIIVATGYDLYPKEFLGEYGAGKLPDVIDGLAFERLLAASGPTAGQVRAALGRDDAKKRRLHPVRRLARPPARPVLLLEGLLHDHGQACADVQAQGAGRPGLCVLHGCARRRQGLRGVCAAGDGRGRGALSDGARVTALPGNGKIVVWGADTLSGRKLEVEADLVVLATAMTASRGSRDLATILGIGVDEHGFYSDAGVLHPVETAKPGIFIAGAGRGPVDIPEAVAQAGAAAAKVIALMRR